MFSYFTDMFASTVAFLSLFLSVACFYQLMVLHVADLTCSLPDHVIVCNENDGGFGSVLWPPLNLACLAACHHAVAGCPAGGHQTTGPSGTTGRLLGEAWPCWGRPLAFGPHPRQQSLQRTVRSTHSRRTKKPLWMKLRVALPTFSSPSSPCATGEFRVHFSF